MCSVYGGRAGGVAFKSIVLGARYVVQRWGTSRPVVWALMEPLKQLIEPVVNCSDHQAIYHEFLPSFSAVSHPQTMAVTVFSKF